jgi:Protein of unknown function (DUF2892)
MFKTNVGGVDRLLRVVASITLIAPPLLGTIGARGWVDVVPLVTAATESCTLYTVLGVNSLGAKKE